MKTYAIYLHPRGPFASVLGSDTLFGAVCWGMRLLALVPDLEQWLKSSPNRFAFSNPFPVWFDDQEQPLLRFLPFPLHLAMTPDLFNMQGAAPQKSNLVDAVRLAKQYKRLIYVSEKVMQLITSDKLTAASIFQNLQLPTKKSTLTQMGNSLLTKQEGDALAAAHIPTQSTHNLSMAMQHNEVDRLMGSTVEGRLFFDNEIYFHPQAGLWALLRAEEQDMQAYIRPALRWLADTGFGANRTTGKGQARIEITDAPSFPSVSSPHLAMMLSRYLPAKGDGVERTSPEAAYNLKLLHPKREQKFVAPAEASTGRVYKQPMWVFVPGSVFPVTAQQELYGRLVRVSAPDDTPIYQCGTAIPMFL